MKKYTLQEAFDKKLLLDKDTVDITLLYLPLKVLLWTDDENELNTISLDKIFYNNMFTNPNKHAAQGEIYRQGAEIYVKIYWTMYSWYRHQPIIQFVADNLLTDMDYNIRAYQEGQREFKIYMGPDITVRFDEDDLPILELPVHSAYTV